MIGLSENGRKKTALLRQGCAHKRARKKPLRLLEAALGVGLTA